MALAGAAMAAAGGVAVAQTQSDVSTNDVSRMVSCIVDYQEIESMREVLSTWRAAMEDWRPGISGNGEGARFNWMLESRRTVVRELDHKVETYNSGDCSRMHEGSIRLTRFEHELVCSRVDSDVCDVFSFD